jgi:hypothetical protein
MKRIDNRQKNLAHRACGRPHSAAIDTAVKRRKMPVITGTKRKGIAGRSKIT